MHPSSPRESEAHRPPCLPTVVARAPLSQQGPGTITETHGHPPARRVALPRGPVTGQRQPGLLTGGGRRPARGSFACHQAGPAPRSAGCSPEPASSQLSVWSLGGPHSDKGSLSRRGGAGTRGARGAAAVQGPLRPDHVPQAAALPRGRPQAAPRPRRLTLSGSPSPRCDGRGPSPSEAPPGRHPVSVSQSPWQVSVRELQVAALARRRP